MRPIVNIEENVGKCVGRFPETVEEAYAQLLRTAAGVLPPLPFPRGVYRFKSLEEADAWEWKYILKAAEANRRSTPPSKT